MIVLNFFGKRANKKEIKRIEAFLLASQDYLDDMQLPEVVKEIETILAKASQRFFKMPPPRFTLERFIEFLYAEAEKEKYEQDISGYLGFVQTYLSEVNLEVLHK